MPLFAGQEAKLELQRCINKPWPEHERAIDEQLRCTLSSHRYIATLAPGCVGRAAEIDIGKMIQTVLEQIHLQLMSAASIDRFETTKASLKQTIVKIERAIDEPEWEFVEG
jgi:hypothetical protein